MGRPISISDKVREYMRSHGLDVQGGPHSLPRFVTMTESYEGLC